MAAMAARAELALHEAAKAGLATQLISPERSKGSLPTTRACNPGPVCRGPQTHLHRRLLRLHRAVAACLRWGTPAQAALPPPLQRRVCAVLHLEDDSIRTALQCLCNATSAQERKSVEVQAKERRANFADHATVNWSAAKAALKPPKASAAFTVDDMRECWSKHWHPDQVDVDSICNAWKDFAKDARMPSMPGSTNAVPSWNQFQSAVACCKGAAGYDGWTAKELKALNRHFPQLLKKI